MRAFSILLTLLLGFLGLAALSPTPNAAKSGGDEGASLELAPVATMAELMSRVILPTSNTVLYVSSRTPESDEEWTEFQMQALLLAESAGLMMTEGRTAEELLQDERWARDVQLLYDAGKKAWEASLARDVEALSELNDPLYTSCVQCHEDFEVVY